MIPDEEVQDELEHCNRKKDEEGLIVVTSLIDKIPNLGGKNTDYFYQNDLLSLCNL